MPILFDWDIEEIVKTLDGIDTGAEAPHMIIAHTTKGKGVSFMENERKWHHGVPSEEQYRTALQEIDGRIAAMSAN